MKPLPFPSSFPEEGIKLISFCPFCQTKQGAVETNILEEDGDSRLLHLRCGQCRASVLLLVTITPLGLNSVGMVTDLSAEDALKFKEDEVVEYDEVIDFHAWLKNDDGLERFLAGEEAPA